MALLPPLLVLAALLVAGRLLTPLTGLRAALVLAPLLPLLASLSLALLAELLALPLAELALTAGVPARFSLQALALLALIVGAALLALLGTHPRLLAAVRLTLLSSLGLPVLTPGTTALGVSLLLSGLVLATTRVALLSVWVSL